MRYGQTWSEYALRDLQRLVNQNLHLACVRNIGRSRRMFDDISAAQNHPFKVRFNRPDYSVAGGYVFGYHTCLNIADSEGSFDYAAAYFYCEVVPDVGNHVISARIVLYATAQPYHEYRNGHDHFLFPLASKSGEDAPLVQHQFGNLITPIVRHYIPVIDSSLQKLLKVREGEGDEIKIMLQDNPAPGRKKVLGTDNNGDLEWRTCPCGSEGVSSIPASSSAPPSYSSVSDTESESVIASSVLDSGSSIPSVDPDKYYVHAHYYISGNPTEEWIDFHETAIHVGAWYTGDCSFGRHISYEPDAPGVYYGYEIRYLAGPFDTYEQALEWENAHPMN